MPTFGDRFRAARLSAGLTQREVAKVLDVRENDIRRWENNRNLPASERLPEIAAVLGVSIDSLFGYKAPRRRAGLPSDDGVPEPADGGRRKRRADRTVKPAPGRRPGLALAA